VIFPKFLAVHTYNAAKKMVLMVKCLICNTKLEYYKQDTAVLIQHIREQHPHLTVNLLRMKPISTRDHGKQTGMPAAPEDRPDNEIFHVLEVHHQESGVENGADKKVLHHKSKVPKISDRNMKRI
jgi:hypothetical protein